LKLQEKEIVFKNINGSLKIPQSLWVNDSIISILELVNKENTIKKYQWFISQFSKSETLKKRAVKSIYLLVKKEDNIAGYQWFIKNYPASYSAKEAIKKMHKLAYEEASKINTISSINTFLIAFPYAKEVEKAVQLSYQLESDKYKQIKKDDERKARLLAVKIKKMVIAMKKQTGNSQVGYEVIIDRMSRLLTEQYEETDASLRYYESKEVTDFASNFEGTMRNIKSVLSQIESNTSNLGKYAQRIVEVTERGFANRKSDRAMSEFNSKQHRKWEKYMHFKDYGYQ